MTISEIDLIHSLNPAYRLLKPRRNDLNLFKSNLLKLLNQIDERESEENVKIFLMDFFKTTFFHPQYLVATKGRTDFVIHLGEDAKTHAGVLFEVKRPGNKADMVTKTDLNKKAMHELILYFFRERLDNKNNSLTHLIITNIYEWFVFDAALFERIFNENTHLQKAYKEWASGQKVSLKTDLFYKEIAKPFLNELEKDFPFTYFDIREYEKWLKGNSENGDKKLIPLYKFFTPPHLLKIPFINDSNSLDKGFFSELLHIIGLEETKDGSKKIIQRLPASKRHPGSLLENTINILEVENSIRKIPSHQLFGDTQDERIFNIALELCITWTNRILFLKLLEAQLLRYHNNSNKYKFLNRYTIQSYQELYKLFFQVLAKENKDRTPQVKQKYSHIPYLNSSLFDISELEDNTIKINGLDDNLEIDLYSNSILKKAINNKNVTAKNTLHYFFEFLDAYDFSSVGKEEVQEENKPIINASVLGLVFEKINGYKDGSIYTPGAITMFLCRETIRKAVVKKFNDTHKWDCETIEDLCNYLKDKRKTKDILQFNQVIESIRIADIAVGSGHFLVSSLNEMLLIKYELGILADDDGNRLTEVEVSIANDELIITDNKTQGFFEYGVTMGKNGENVIPSYIQHIQEVFFNEKRKIIEKCLFGVDININSVKICQLRLWIELLKHAFYKKDSGFAELETLPNIDINIKNGNSLLSKFDINEDLSEVFKKQRFGIGVYQDLVATYKNTPNKESKTSLQSAIKTFKEQFHQTVYQRDPRRKKLRDLRGQLALAQNNMDLFGQKQPEKEMQAEVAKINTAIGKIEGEITEIENNVIYRNAFEWRFEFPEVLDSRGIYEGFEVIIGNPPYIQLQKMGASTDVLQTQNYKTFARTGDIYALFYELAFTLLKPGYYLGFITSNKWMRANYGEALRKFFIEKTNPLLLVDFGGYQVFDSATVDTNVLIAQNAANQNKTQTCVLDKSLGSLEKMSDFISQNSSLQTGFTTNSWVILSGIEASIKRKIEAIGTPLKDWDIQINYGIKTGFNEAFIIDGAKRIELVKKCPKAAEIIRPILRGRDIKKYKINFENKWIIFTRRGIDIELYPAVRDYLQDFYTQLKPRNNNESYGRKPGSYEWYEIQDNVAYHKDFAKEKIVWIELTDKPNFAIDNSGYYINNTIFFITGDHLKYLLAFLNSRLCEWYFDKIAATSGVGTRRWIKIYIDQICVPKPSKEIEARILSLVNKAESNLTAIIVKEINFSVYNLFALSPNEISFIEAAEL